MKTGKAIFWVGVLLAVAACGTAPTPTPTTALESTPAPTTAPASTSTAAATTASATATGAASPTGADITPAAPRAVAAGEVVKLAGNSFTTSDIFRFSADTTLDITWNYTGTAPFALWLINASENVTDPNYDRILVDDVTGPHSGTAKQMIIAGDWTVQVEQADGPWTVQFTPES